jgi:DNA-binding transcriptional LysR family regulator
MDLGALSAYDGEMDLRQLQYFVAIADASSFGRASALLGIAQSALSAQIKRLEAEIGTDLFVRSPRTISLTSAGVAMLPEARKTLVQAALTVEIGQRAARGEVGSLRLGYARAAPWHLPGRVVDAFQSLKCDAAIDLRELTSHLQVAALRNGELDVGVIIGPPDDPDVKAKLIARESLFIVCGPTHPFAKRAGVTLRDIKDQELYVLAGTYSHEVAATISAAFQDAGFTPHVTFEGDEIRMLWGLVTGGRGISFGYRSFAAANIPGLVFLPVVDSTRTFDFYLAWNGSSTDKLLGRLVDAVPLWKQDA